MWPELFRSLHAQRYPDIFGYMAPPKIKGWARKHRQCKRCGRTSIPHRARGLCQSCYNYLVNVLPFRERQRGKAARKRASQKASRRASS